MTWKVDILSQSWPFKEEKPLRSGLFQEQVRFLESIAGYQVLQMVETYTQLQVSPWRKVAGILMEERECASLEVENLIHAGLCPQGK